MKLWEPLRSSSLCSSGVTFTIADPVPLIPRAVDLAGIDSYWPATGARRARQAPSMAGYAAVARRVPRMAITEVGPLADPRGWTAGGTLRLHREALGLDLLRAPLNVLLVGPALFLRLAGALSVATGLFVLILAGVAEWFAIRGDT